jgi:pimeloyl-ACP methyl ester carboxylesterase
MLHEGLGSVSLWKDFPERLAHATDCAVFVYSRRGYGGSDPLAAKREPRYMHHEAETVLPAVLEAAGIHQPILFGHSDGGSIALLYAAKYPHGTRGLVLEAPHVFVEPLTIESIAAAKTVYSTTDLGAKLGRHHHDPDHTFWGWNDIWLDERFLHWNIEERLSSITCPLLLIQGRDDEYGTPRQLDSIARHTGLAEILLLDRCRHSPHRDQPDAVLQSTQQFLQRCGIEE